MLLAVVASYLPVLGAPFVWDDHHLVEKNPLVQDLQPLVHYFDRGFWQGDELEPGRAYYRPLTILSLALDHAVYGNNPAGFHLSNLLLLLISTVLAFQLLRARGASGIAAALGAGFWSLQPRSTEAVAWISGRTDVLAGLFVVAALLVHARGTTRARWGCAALLLLGLMCKEVALAGLVAVLGADLLLAGTVAAKARRVAPLLVAGALYVLLRAHAINVVAPPQSNELYRFRWDVTAAAVGHYAVMLLTPWFPNLQIGHFGRPEAAYVALGGVVAFAVLAGLVRFRRRIEPNSALALLLLGSGLGLVLHVISFSINVIAADRFLYLPLLGLTLLLVPLAERLPWRRYVALGAGLVVASFGIATFARSNVWADEVALWARAYLDSPGNRNSSTVELGRLYARAGLLDHALTLDSQPPDAVFSRHVLANNTATVLARAGQYREAIAVLRSLGPPSASAPVFTLNIALFQTYLNDFSAARLELSRLLAVAPEYAAARSLLTRLPAMEARRQRLAALPEQSAALERARGFEALGMAVEAARAWRIVLRDPSRSRNELEEGVRFALLHGDAATTDELVRLYAARSGGNPEPGLALAYQAQLDLRSRLLDVWPSLHLPLTSLPS